MSFATDYGRPVWKSPSLHGQKSTHTPKFLGKDDSDYLAFKENTWSYSKFVYRSTFLCEPVPPLSQPIQICCTTMTNMQTELRYL